MKNFDNGNDKEGQIDYFKKECKYAGNSLHQFMLLQTQCANGSDSGAFIFTVACDGQTGNILEEGEIAIVIQSYIAT